MTAPDATPAPAPQPATSHATPSATVGGPAGERSWVRDITVFLGGQTVSLLGSMLVQYAVLWHLTLTTKSGWILGLSALIGFLPQGIVSIFGGVWADRYNRRTLIIGADAAIATVTAGLAIAFWLRYTELWLVFVVLFVRSLGAGIQTPAVGAVLPQIVPTDKLMRVNGINGSIQSGMSIVAPALAAWLYASFDLEVIFSLDVITACAGISLIATLRIARPERPDGPLPGYFADVMGGLRYVASHRVVRRITVIYATVFLLIVPPSYLTPLLVARSFGDEVWRLTANELAFSIGMLAGGAIIAAWGGLKNRMTMIAITTVAFGVLGVGLGLAPWFWLFLVFMGLTGLALSGFSTPAMTLLQETTEPDKMGRVWGLLGVVIALAMPLGMTVFGPLADAISIEVILVVTGVLTAAIGLTIFASSAAIGREADAERSRLHPETRA